LNRVITRNQYRVFVKWILENSITLIGAEMNNLPGTPDKNGATPPVLPTLLPFTKIPDLIP
jgi:hypothetical protein